jgi:hypothetical protein
MTPAESRSAYPTSRESDAITILVTVFDESAATTESAAWSRGSLPECVSVAIDAVVACASTKPATVETMTMPARPSLSPRAAPMIESTAAATPTSSDGSHWKARPFGASGEVCPFRRANTSVPRRAATSAKPRGAKRVGRMLTSTAATSTA